jgi:hypothetical protein
VHGKVVVDNTWPVVTQQRLSDWLQESESSYRRQRRKRRPETFSGFLPPHSLFQQYKSRRKRQDGSQAPNKKRKKKESVELTEPGWEQVWKSLNEFLSKDENDDGPSLRLVELDWKTARKEFPGIKVCFDKASELYNQLVRGKQEAAAQDDDDDDNSSDDMPMVFRVQEELDTTSFYINAPLAHVADDFSMRLPPSLQDAATRAGVQTGSPDLDYKPSLTKCTVFASSSAADDGMTTKVWLEPRTGRRHQLRVHMALMHHAIVGDVTYSSPALSAQRRTGRMCLHAHQLTIDLDGKQRLEFQAPDPFRVDEDKIIVVEEF